MTSFNGQNTNTNQNNYDLVFKDVIVSSDKRNYQKYPNPNNYTINLNLTINKIYKAEIIDVYIPSATDKTVNIPPDQNRLYFKYTNTYGDPPVTKTTIGYIVIQPGTYCSPSSIAKELSRQFDIVLTYAGFEIGECTVGAQQDLAQLTRTVRSMVLRYAMARLQELKQQAQQRNLFFLGSDVKQELNNIIDNFTTNFMDITYNEVISFLETIRPGGERLVDQLMISEELTGKDLRTIAREYISSLSSSEVL
jgi:hypothetical protein